MYAADLNCDSLELTQIRKEIIDQAGAMLAGTIDNQDYDLTAELLLSWTLLSEPWSASSVFAFRVLTQIEDEIGFLPSLNVQIKIAQKLENEERRRYLLGTTYHTKYVMGLLCASILQYDRIPPNEIPQKESIPGSAKKIMTYIRPTNNDPYWMSLYKELSEQQQDSLATFLFNVALLQNAHNKEYKNLYQLLKLGDELGLTNTAIARQTAELLERIYLISKGPYIESKS
jgi:hypothetical protein